MDLRQFALAMLPPELQSRIRKLAESDEMTTLARRFGQAWYDGAIPVYLVKYFGGFEETERAKCAGKPDPTAADILAMHERECREIAADYPGLLGPNEHILVAWGDKSSQRFLTTKRFIYRTKAFGGAKVGSVDFAEGESLVEVLRDTGEFYLHTTSRLLGLEFEDGAVKVNLDVALRNGETLVQFVDVPPGATVVFFVTNQRIMAYYSGSEQSEGYAELALYPGESLEAMMGDLLPSPFLTNRRFINVESLAPMTWVSYEPGPGASAILRKNVKKGLFSFLTSPYTLVVTASGEKVELAVSDRKLPAAEKVVQLFS